MALPIFYFKTGSDKLVNLIRDDQMTFAKLSINVIAWISVPNETYDFQKNSLFLLSVGLLVRAPKITFVALPAQGAPPNRFSCRALPARLVTNEFQMVSVNLGCPGGGEVIMELYEVQLCRQGRWDEQRGGSWRLEMRTKPHIE